jgi:putative ATPase
MSPRAKAAGPSLFSAAGLDKDAPRPLADKLRPQKLDEVVGQDHLLGPDGALTRMLSTRSLGSLVFWGPPGTGKTTVARLLAQATDLHFEQISAIFTGVADLKKVFEAARARRESGQGTLLFVDEIHRFNRAQQDILLGDVEAGLIILVGATTENPFFAVNAPLVSRSQIFQFTAISEEDIKSLVRRAIADKERGFGNLKFEISDEAIDLWATMSDGDARRALSALEVAVLSTTGVPPVSSTEQHGHGQDARGTKIVIDLDVAEQSMQRKAIVYDGTGDEHYDAASALIKSMRGSDPDAAVYWLARMLEAGEDPRFIARRIAILASEDIGNADPQAICVAAAAYTVVERIGMPEAQLTLAQAAIYMAMAPKSNASALAIWQASSDVLEGRTLPVPKHLKDSHYKGSKRLGYGEGYQYPHDHPGAKVDQEYLGVPNIYYRPTERGKELDYRQQLKSRDENQAQADRGSDSQDRPEGSGNG